MMRHHIPTARYKSICAENLEEGVDLALDLIRTPARRQAMGEAGSEPEAVRVIDASGCLVTPGLINTHHHIYQNLTRSFPPATQHNLFGWLSTLYPIWANIDEEASYLAAWIGFAELALGGCTTTMDHMYVHPTGAGDLITAEITAAKELGMRFHATRGSMSRSKKASQCLLRAMLSSVMTGAPAVRRSISSRGMR